MKKDLQMLINEKASQIESRRLQSYYLITLF
jgi:hypothetical protein